MRDLISNNSPFERSIGFSRAVRVGSRVEVSGTAPIADDGSPFAPDDLAAQTRRCLDIALDAAARAGASKADVIRTRVMLTDISRWEEAAAAHGEVFADVRPASTFVEVSGLIDPAWLVEIEVECEIEAR